SAWRVVLLSGVVLAEVPSGLPPFAASRADGWPRGQGSPGAARSGLERAGVALASSLGLPRGLHRSVHTEPNADQHPPLLGSLGAAGAVAGATSAHAGVTATLGLVCRPHRSLAYRRVGSCVGGNS